MLRAIAIIAIIMFALTGVTLAAGKTRGAAHLVSGEVVSMDATAGTVTVKLADPKDMSQMKEGEKVTVRRARNKAAKTSAPAPVPAPAPGEPETAPSTETNPAK